MAQCPMVLLKGSERGWYHCRHDAGHKDDHEPFRQHTPFGRPDPFTGTEWVTPEEAEKRDRELRRPMPINTYT